MNFKKGDKIVFVTEGLTEYYGDVFTFDRYYSFKEYPRDYLWTKELPAPIPSYHFRLATLLEIELQSE